MQMWRIEKFELTEVPEEKYGQFTSGDCYVVLYSYGDPQKHVVYMWQGAASTVDERGACAMCAVQIDEQHCGGSAPQVRPLDSSISPQPPSALLRPLQAVFKWCHL